MQATIRKFDKFVVTPTEVKYININNIKLNGQQQTQILQQGAAVQAGP